MEYLYFKVHIRTVYILKKQVVYTRKFLWNFSLKFASRYNKMKKYKISVIPGDGIGLEVTKAALYVLKNLDLSFEFIMCEAGLNAWKKYKNQVPEETIDAIKETKIAYYGAATTLPGPKTPKSVAVTLRQTFDLYANVRPAKSREGVPRPVSKDVDMVIVRENTEGLYSGLEFKLTDDTAIGINKITKRCSERIARYAFELARKRKKVVTATHKANILKESHGLFKGVCDEMAKDYPDIRYWDIFVDALTAKLIEKPEIFDVIVAPNLLGDIISDEASALVGGLGLVPSANIGDNYALFEPVHGSAPDIAGKGISNPIAMILSGAMMLDYLGEKGISEMIENAVNEVLVDGRIITPDLGGTARTMEVAEEIVRKLM